MGIGFNNTERKMFKTVCSECQNECEVPFEPSGDRPVYCRTCFSARKARQAN